MTPQKQRIEALVRGYVQGVGFRAFVRREARSLGLVGSVRNGAEGGVYVVAEGERFALVALIGALQVGPSEAEVQDVDVTWKPYTGAFADFEVRF
jgi:acylphosphatase